MAPLISDEDAVARAREVRSADLLQESDRDVLEKYRAFLQSHEADSARTATHTVLESYPDWWCRARRAPPGLLIEGEADEEELFKVIGGLHGMGVPLTLAEKRTVAFRFFQDVEVWGTRDACVSASDLVGPENELTLLLGRIIGEVYPQPDGFRDAAIFDATGLSQTKGVMKTSVRIVWPSIVVDADRAARIRDLIVHRLTAVTAEDGVVAQLENRLRELSSSNAWHNVFGDAAYSSRANVRMPMCDRVSPLPLRAPEKRPLNPIGVLRYSFASDGSVKAAEWLCEKEELDGNEWAKIGSLRQPEDAKLTEWSVPAGPSVHQPIPQSSTRTGRVKVRTAGGSEAMISATLKNARVARAPNAEPERAGQLLTIERSFSGSADDFCDKVEPVLGKAILEPDGTRVWKQPGTDARVVMYCEDQRIKVIGRTNQVRSLVVIVSPYTEAVQHLGAAVSERPQQQSNLRPSAAYEPASLDNTRNAASEADGVSKNECAGADASTAASASQVGKQRLVSQAFESQGQGELELTCDDIINVTNDPEGIGDNCNEDRWVYGRSEASGLSGWFPLSHTISREDRN